MRVEPFLLDQWLELKFHADPPIRHDLASSTGPEWPLRELLDLAGPKAMEELLDVKLLYSDAAGNPTLRREIAALEGVSEEAVLVVSGAAEALNIVLFHVAEPGGNIVLPRPVFPPVVVLARSLGLELRFFALRPQEGFCTDLDEVRRLVDGKTRLLYVNSPHNPTGAVLHEADLRALHDLAAERKTLFVSDQVYHPIYHGPPSVSCAALPRATVLRSLSKAFCLSGLRLGWIVERDPGRRAQFLDLRSYFTISNVGLGECLGILAIRNREAILKRARTVARRNLELLDDFFERHAGRLGWVRPKGGFTAFPWLLDGSDSRALCQDLARSGVLVAPGDCFGVPAHFRIGFGAVEEGYADALACFTAVLERAA